MNTCVYILSSKSTNIIHKYDLYQNATMRIIDNATHVRTCKFYVGAKILIDSDENGYGPGRWYKGFGPCPADVLLIHVSPEL